MNLRKSAGLKIIPALLIVVSLASLFWLSSCKDDPFEYKLDRASAFSFRLDTFDVVLTTDVVFYMGPSVLHTFEDSSQVLFQRISLQAHGVTPKGKEFWFIVDFDTHADGNAVGLYRTEYDYEDGGINDLRLIINDNGEFFEYSSVPDLNTVFFQVDAQRPEERIMKGIFGGIIFKDGEPLNGSAFISDGVFKDIYY